MLRVRRRWNSHYPPQVYLVGTIDDRLAAKHGMIDVELLGRSGFVRIELPRRRVHRPTATGPYLALATARLDPYSALEYREVVLQAIVNVDNPVPVESSHEREVALLLQAMRLRFYKPMRDFVEDLRPDFMLLNQRILIEVQGMRTEGYDERKREIHERMVSHPALCGWQLIRYDARTEKLGALRKRLQNWWRIPS